MTRFGIITQLYSEIAPRPFSRFTTDPKEIQANLQWTERASARGEQNFDKYGHHISQV